MARDGAGTYSLPQAPFVSGTVISSTAVNSDFSDIATALTQSIARDGQTVPTANLPMGGYRLTGLGNASARTDAAPVAGVQDGSYVWCGTAGGTADAITLTPSPAVTALATGVKLRFKAGASPNTTATTIVVSGLASKAAQINDAALVAGDIAANKYYEALYDGTAFQIQRISGPSSTIADGSITNAKLANMAANTVKVRAANSSGVPSDVALAASQLLGRGSTGDVAAIALGTGLSMSGATLNAASSGWTVATVQTTTSGTAFDFTGIPATAKEIAVLFNGVGLSGTDHFLIQIGDSGGIETTSYVSSSGDVTNFNTSTTGFIVRCGNGTPTMTGRMTITLFEASSFTWVASQGFGRSDGSCFSGGGTKALSAALDRVRITRTGTDTFDGGSVTVAYI